MKWYAGLTKNHAFEAFRATATPTPSTHGDRFRAVVGPFRTRRAALWCEQYGYNNPHGQTVAEMEKLAKAATT